MKKKLETNKRNNKKVNNDKNNITNDKNLPFYLFFTLLLLLIYIIVIGRLIYNNKLEIELITQDLENKRLEKEFLVSEIVRLKKEQQGFVGEIDLNMDSSIQKFVTSSRSFNNKSYVPSNLETISSKLVFDTKGGTQMLRKEANEKLQMMSQKFYKDFGEKIVVVSAYRSYEYQKGIKERGCPDNLCSKPGYSEHQSGLAVDLWEASTNYEWITNERLQRYYKWLNENAQNYGFHNTYQKGLHIDGYEIEPWHWRYVGEELATYLKENDLTIAEFYKQY